MSMRARMCAKAVAMIAAAVLLSSACASPPTEAVGALEAQPAAQPVNIWDGPPPGRPAPALPESANRQSQGWRDITVVKNVATPTLTVVRPAQGQANGSAMLVLPGGAFLALAWDLEGTEVAEYLAQRGITAFVLKYRVRDASPDMLKTFQANPTTATLFTLTAENRAEATADALQAVRFLRKNAAAYGIDPNRIGMMGFSAGAGTTISALYKADDESRPNIAAPIYGLRGEKGAPPKAPPLFMAVASDDKTTPAPTSAEILNDWLAAGASAELHVFETGEHGFGLGRPGTASTAWPALFEAWLVRRGFITKQ